MNNVELKSNKVNLFSCILKVVLVLVGIIYMESGLLEIFPGENLETTTVINVILGLILIVTGIKIPAFRANVQLNMTDDFLQSTDGSAYKRSAYWHKLEKIILTKYSIRITYNSGAREQFRLPFLTEEKYQKLRNALVSKSRQHDFKIEEKPWWKLSKLFRKLRQSI